MKYTVWVNFRYCSGIFKSEKEAKLHANKLALEELGMSNDEVRGYDEDDWWQLRDDANIKSIEFEEEPT